MAWMIIFQLWLSLAATDQALSEQLAHDIEKIDRSVADTKKIIRLSLDASYLPDLYFHLAELYVDKSRFEHEKLTNKAGNSQNNLNHAQSITIQISKRLAIEIYDKILTDFPNYEHLDQVYFFKGHEYRELGLYDDMLNCYQTLILKIPYSKWSNEARLVLANYYFDKSEFDKSEKYFKDIIDRHDSSLKTIAYYKMGWIRIYQNKFKESLDFLKESVILAKKFETTEKRQSSIKRDALMAMAWPYSEIHKPEDAAWYFRKLADSEIIYLDAMRKLSNRYTIQNKNIAASIVDRDIVYLSYDAEVNIDYLAHIVDAVNDMPINDIDRYENVDNDVGALSRTFEQLNNRPYPVQTRADAPKINLTKLNSDFELHSRDLVTKAHVFLQKNNGYKKISRSVIRAYADYLKTFSDAKQANIVKLDYAGVLYDTNQYLRSAEVYEELAKDINQTAKNREDYLYRAMNSYYNVLDEDIKKREKNSSDATLLNSLQLLRARQGLKQLGEFFEINYPQSDKIADIRFNVARMYYQEGELQKSAELFSDFIKRYPTHKNVSTAGNLALDALYKLDNLDAMISMADAFAKNNQIRDDYFRREALHIAENTRRRKVEFAVITTSEGDFGNKMLTEFEKNKGSKEGEQYLYAGFSQLKAQGDITGSLQLGQKLIEAYPKSKWFLEVAATMGTLYAESMNFDQAIVFYEMYQNHAEDSREGLTLLQNAADMRFILGDFVGAEKDFIILLQKGNDKQKEYALDHLFVIYTNQSEWPKLQHVALDALAKSRRVSNYFYAGLSYMMQDNTGSAKEYFNNALRAIAKSDAEDLLHEHAAFEIAKINHTYFYTIAFRDVKSSEAVLKHKLDALKSTEEAYLKALKNGHGAWSIASIYGLSRLYQDFAIFIVQAPVPAGISAADYHKALQEQADPYISKAKNMLDSCAKKSEEIGLLSAFAAACAGKHTSIDNSITQIDKLDILDTQQKVVPRSASTQDAAYQKNIEDLREQLLKKPKNVDLLKDLFKQTMQSGDYHLAQLILASLADIRTMNQDVLSAWQGVVAWYLGEYQQAEVLLKKAAHQGYQTAALNLAGLYFSYGYQHLAKITMPDTNKISHMPTTNFDIHPAVQDMLNAFKKRP